ncbi:hypothetical protein [Sulfurimonas sp. HSL3-7]|uniref:hypothetical protein n=1 Tax=Sulfonitrofixus jiaomeiensis TaxID=3131938 RepID=UPI0031FA0F07
MMKLQKIACMTLVSILMLGFSACSSGPKPDEIDADEDLKCTKNGAPAPEWVCKNVVGDAMQTAVGHSDYSRIGDNFMLQEATDNGQKEMQQVVSHYIEDKLATFSRKIGGKAAVLTDGIASSIASEVSGAKKEDYKQIKLWRNPTDSSIEVLMAVQEKNINKDVRQKLLLALKKDDAVYKEYEENDGEDLLDDLLPLD